MLTVGERIKKRRKELKLSADYVAKKLGKNRATVYRYESDEIEDMSINVIRDISKILTVDPTYLMGMKDDPEDFNTQNDYNYFPTAISAGLPFEVDGITEAKKLSVPNTLMGRWAGNEEIFLTKIYGDSMDKVMQDGSIIAVLPTPIGNLKEGDIVVFSDNHEYSVKHYHKEADKLIFKPNSKNKDHHEQHFDLNENIAIHGKVVMWTVISD